MNGSSGLSGRRVVLTGGSGFLGRRVDAEFRSSGAQVMVARKKDYDLVEREACRRLLNDTHPDVVVHLAARVGGIGANRENPGLFFFENLMMGAQLVEECRLARVPKDDRDHLLVSEAHAGSVQGRGALGWIPGGNQRPGAGFEITIHELTQLIARLIGFTGDIRWDTSKPDGQPRRSLDTTKAEGLFGFRAEIGFEEGLQKTIAWYRQHQGQAR